MARTPLEQHVGAGGAIFKVSRGSPCAGATSASGDRGGAETIPFVGIQKCRAMICFYDPAYSLPRDRFEKKPSTLYDCSFVLPARGDEPGPPAGCTPALAAAESIACPFRCARSPTRSPSWSSTSRPSQAHHDPTPESGLAGSPRAGAANDLRRRSVAAGCLRPRRRPGCVHRATHGSRSGRSEIVLPSDCRRRLRRRRPAGGRSGR